MIGYEKKIYGAKTQQIQGFGNKPRITTQDVKPLPNPPLKKGEGTFKCSSPVKGRFGRGSVF